ncbi:formyl transferase [Stachybotrys elegans]|uniref:methionyl-tRNA formyltransferase n=1 Tax=Stachybotrys elegans TaxID=80388 RepID=A0A8K0WW57_9HYPO|nr:formyl transferase [Stachybotrys elegans]
MTFRLARFAGAAAGLRTSPARRWYSKTSDPLRILFCGSDDFSCRSLRALHEEKKRNPALIESMEVMVRPPKRTGRGYKQLREVPCQTLAERLGLKTHQRDTFREWELPEGTNLIVAVSFGLFVPPRILGSAKYGGLNVHPSFLPDLRGPAPIHHALLRRDEYIGVSLQTLDSRKFDHGTILAQTPPHTIPIRPEDTLSTLIEAAGDVGAEMLVQGLRDGLHVAPHEDVGSQLEGKELRHAPKVTKGDSRIDWVSWDAEDFRRRTLVSGSVWSMVLAPSVGPKRAIFRGVKPVPREAVRGKYHVLFSEEAGVEVRVGKESTAAFVVLRDGSWVSVESVLVEGKAEQPAAFALKPFLVDPLLDSPSWDA